MPLCREAGRWLGNLTSMRGGGVSIRLAQDSCLGLWRCFSGVRSPSSSPCGCRTAASAALSAGVVPAEWEP